MVDAPLFQLSLGTRSDDGDVEIVLPPRKQADGLVGSYWRHIQPIDFFLAKDRFDTSYEALFAGTLPDDDDCVFLSTLNLVFAFATQTQEHMPHKKRDGMANVYFHRAWNLLRPGGVLWESGTPEMVQCLLLMGRYLQCTQNKYQAWMAVGSAIRIARNLGLHLADPSATGSDEEKWQHHIWNCCLMAEL